MAVPTFYSRFIPVGGNMPILPSTIKQQRNMSKMKQKKKQERGVIMASSDDTVARRPVGFKLAVYVEHANTYEMASPRYGTQQKPINSAIHLCRF